MLKSAKKNKRQSSLLPYAARRVYDVSENLNHAKEVALVKLNNLCLNYKPIAKGPKARVRKGKKELEEKIQCKAIDLPQNIRDEFVAIKKNIDRNIIKRNETTLQDNNPNIRRLELVTTGKLFHEISASNNQQDTFFMTSLNKSLFLDNDTVRGYLTWSTYHFLDRPSVTKLRDRDKPIMEVIYDEVYPQNICFFSL